MTEEKPRKNILTLLTADLVLGSLVAILGIVTAVAGYQSSMADSDQTKYNVQGQQMLTDANAEYLTANQLIVYDYSLYDGYYTADTIEKEEYYQSSFSEELQNSMAENSEDIFNDTYYDAMYADAQAMFDESDNLFNLAEEFNERGDKLQLVMLISAIGLGFAAWASLLKEENRMRLFFAIVSIAMLVYAIIIYVGVPTVTAAAG
jgi:hypothetical protein